MSGAVGAFAVPGYSEVRELGRGGAGRVILATHDSTGVPVAIKYLDERLHADQDYLREFRAEARLLAELDSANIVGLYEYVESDAGAAIVMELVNGVSLRAMVRELGPTEPEAALCVLKGSLLGLAAAHAIGVVHRDFKPENVLVDEAGASKLSDFGIAARAGHGGASSGTPAYMAPEQWAGGPASPATDIYAATATFYECLVGTPPFTGAGDLVSLRRAHEQAQVPVDQVPPALHGLLRDGLAKDPTRRPADAQAFLAELDAQARTGFGAGWEERGRRRLARRAALLALLFPLAGELVAGVATATTVLGASKLKPVVIGIGTALVLVIGAAGTYIGLTPGPAPGEPAAIATPSSPASGPSGSTPASPSTTPTGSASPGASTAPPPPPPPPPPKTTVTGVGVEVYLVPIAGPSHYYRARVDVTTSGPGTVKLYVLFGGSRTAGGAPQTSPQQYPITLFGKTQYNDVLVPVASGYEEPDGCPGAFVVAKVSTASGPTAQDSIAC